jgi:mannose-6-phosphate isomerase-like protein (cupin superfamily)
MTGFERPTFDLVSTYVRLADEGGAVPVDVGNDFWTQVDNQFDFYNGRLVRAFLMTDNSPEWEMHPEGDEILYLLSGAIDMILQTGDRERIVELRPGAACIVPRGVWHRANIRRASKGLFITPGRGTQHRPV